MGFFIKKNNFLAVFFFLFVFNKWFAQEIIVKGFITSSDSITAMPYAYVINTNTGHGEMSDGNGRFSINASLSDSIIFSFIGYKRLKIPVKKLLNNNGLECKIVMHEVGYNLNQIV